MFRHALIWGLLFSFFLGIIGAVIHNPLPVWLGGSKDVVGLSSKYFLVYSLTLPFILLFYMSAAMLKSSGNMKTPSMMSVLACIFDVSFNYLFIYILKLGVVGAALGTTSAYILTSLPMLYFAAVKSKILALHQDHTPFHLVWGYIRNASKISGPIALQSILMSGAQIISTLIVAPLGNIAIASNSLAITAESLCYMPGYGIGDAATTLVGQTHGANRIDLCKNFAHMTVGIGMIVMAFMGAFMYIFAPEMMSLLSPVNAIQELGSTVLRIEAFAEPFFAASIVTYSVCVGAGDTLKPALMNLASMWMVRLTLAYTFSKSIGLRGVWVAMAIELTFRGCIFLIRLFKGNWMKGFNIHASVPLTE